MVSVVGAIHILGNGKSHLLTRTKPVATNFTVSESTNGIVLPTCGSADNGGLLGSGLSLNSEPDCP